MILGHRHGCVDVGWQRIADDRDIRTDDQRSAGGHVDGTREIELRAIPFIASDRDLQTHSSRAGGTARRIDPRCRTCIDLRLTNRQQRKRGEGVLFSGDHQLLRTRQPQPRGTCHRRRQVGRALGVETRRNRRIAHGAQSGDECAVKQALRRADTRPEQCERIGDARHVGEVETEFLQVDGLALHARRSVDLGQLRGAQFAAPQHGALGAESGECGLHAVGPAARQCVAEGHWYRCGLRRYRGRQADHQTHRRHDWCLHCLPPFFFGVLLLVCTPLNTIPSIRSRILSDVGAPTSRSP